MKRKFMKRVLSVVICTICCSIMVFPSVVSANENEEFQVYPETQVAIDEAIAQDKVNPSYIDNVIELFNNEIHTNSDELNDFLLQSLDASIAVNEKTDNELLAIEAELEALQTQNNNLKAPRASLAETAYLAGVTLVQRKGCPQTAAYMLTGGFNDKI